MIGSRATTLSVFVADFPTIVDLRMATRESGRWEEISRSTQGEKEDVR